MNTLLIFFNKSTRNASTKSCFTLDPKYKDVYECVYVCVWRDRKYPQYQLFHLLREAPVLKKPQKVAEADDHVPRQNQI